MACIHRGGYTTTVMYHMPALCNPRDEQGRNATPTRRELHNCAGFLRATIDLVQPRIVVVLGATALWTLGQLTPHHVSLRRAVATALPWYDRYLFPLYHPGPRAMIKRNFAAQLEDYARLAEFCTSL